MGKRNVFTRMVASIVASHFEPIELVLALSAIVHGLWMWFPYWEGWTLASVSGTPRAFELTVGALLGVAGLVHLYGLLINRRARGLRRAAAFSKFIMWFFFTGLAVMASGFASIIWFPYATVTLVSALVYLNISVGGLYGND